MAFTAPRGLAGRLTRAPCESNTSVIGAWPRSIHCQVRTLHLMLHVSKYRSSRPCSLVSFSVAAATARHPHLCASQRDHYSELALQGCRSFLPGSGPRTIQPDLLHSFSGEFCLSVSVKFVTPSGVMQLTKHGDSMPLRFLATGCFNIDARYM